MRPLFAGDYLDMDVLWTWEFDRSYPCRSMASIRLFSLPFMLIGKGASHACPPPRTHADLQARAISAAALCRLPPDLSALLGCHWCVGWFGCYYSVLRLGPTDWCTWQLLPPAARWKGLTLWAGSGAVLAFSVRSFSNNVEAALLGLCFVALQRLASTGTVSLQVCDCVRRQTNNGSNCSLASPVRSKMLAGMGGPSC